MEDITWTLTARKRGEIKRDVKMIWGPLTVREERGTEGDTMEVAGLGGSRLRGGTKRRWGAQLDAG